MKKLFHSLLALLALLPATASAQPEHRSFQGHEAAPQTARHATLSSTEAYRKPSFINAATSYTREARKAPVPMRAGDGTTLYGEVTFSNSMNTPSADAIQWGLYSFPASANTSFTQLTLHNTLCANGGGAYRKGNLHFTSYYEDMSGELGYLYFCTMDLATYTIDRKALYPDSYGSIGVDMTYDPVGDILYTVSFEPSDLTLSNYMLASIDVNTGYATKIADIDRMSAIACDNMGQLWGIRYSDGMLVKIDKLNATTTNVGATGVNPIYNGSATFDFVTGKLYWTTDERTTDIPGLYEVNITTGKADLVTLYPDGEHVSSLYIPRADDITNLAPLTGLAANFSGAATEGTLCATAPATDKSGNALSGDVTVAGYIDGMLVFSTPTDPGSTISQPITLAQGPHTFEAVATHPTAGRSERASISFYVGYDGPAAVTDLTVSRVDDTHAKITWETPSTGANGGTINPALVFYQIVRMPDGVLVSDEATGNEYTDVITSDILRPYFYEVTGFYRNIEGETATSNAVEFGKPAELPYKQTFDTMDDYKTFVVRNNNPDPSHPTEGFWGWFQDLKCAAYKYHTLLPGDDYLITPGMYFTPEQSYKLKFKAKGGRLYPETLEVLMGRGVQPADFTITLMPPTEILSPNDAFGDYEAVISVQEAGNYYIAFHAITPKGQFWLYVDDVEVAYGPNTASPGTVSNLSATPGTTATEVNLAMTAPALDFAGNTLGTLTAINILRDGKLTGSITEGVAPGMAATYTDKDVPAGKHTYTAVAVNASGESNPVSVECWAGSDIPNAPTEVTHVTNDGINAIISWTAPTEGENGGCISYEPVKYLVTDENNTIVANGITETTCTVPVDASEGQCNKYYFVYAVNSAGGSYGAGSGFITYGKAYQDAFAESFAGGQGFTTQDWIMTVVVPSPYSNEFYNRYWGFEHIRTDRGPRPEAQDGDGGLLIAYTDYLNVESRMISPKINVSGLKNPVLSFYFYHYYNPDTENGYSHAAETMDVETYIDGQYRSIIAKPIMLIDGNGWYRYDIALKDAVGDKDFQIAFHTHNYLSYDMHIDNITVHDVKDYDLTVTKFDVPSLVSVNSSRNIKVTVLNNGAKTATDYSVDLYRDGKLWKSLDGEALEFAKEKTYLFAIEPDITESGNNHTYYAVVDFAYDENTADNTSDTKTSTVPGNNLPAPSGLTGTGSTEGAVLTWNDPEDPVEGETTEGFEAYEPFTISLMGEWTLIDNDGSLTYTISNSGSTSGDYEYPNAGTQMAFQVFNPGMAGISSSLWTPYLGNQMAVCFDAAERDNDDWLISPEVKGGTKVSFMARSVVANYGLEKFYFCYSTTDTEMASFNVMGSVNNVPADAWTLYEFTLPEDAVYFAINCVSSNAYALLLDEVTYTSAHPAVLEFKGFNVYRDGVRINSEIVEESTYTDTTADPAGNYVYHVTAVYDKGESGLSNGFSLNMAGLESITAGKASVTVAGTDICVNGAAGRYVSVFAASGISLFGDTVADKARISATAGVYIVTIGTERFKVIVR